jgi:CDP-6-deoxy-D-xylo-4-hexulose-3-dehydrase
MFWKLQENIITASDLDLLVEFIRETKRFTQYTKVAEFERTFAAWQGCRYCVYVNSGSAANLILVNAAKELFNWQDGDEVIVPAVTWPTTITPVMQFGLTPVFLDVNLSDLSIDYDSIGSKITARTRAIFVAHLLGFPANIERLKEIIGKREIVILEDSCESQGATLNGIKVGNLGLAGTFSFYWGHHMTTVEGGMICTDNESLYKLLLLKRSHGLARELPPEQHDALKKAYENIDFNFLFLTDGFNVRNTEFNAVIGLAQLERIDDYIAVRNRNYRLFLTICSKYEKHLILLDSPGISSFVLPFLFKNRERKEAFQALIRDAGIESRPLISGNLLRQPFLSKYNRPGEYQQSDFLHTNAFYIGNNQFVDESRLEVLAALMQTFFEGSA